MFERGMYFSVSYCSCYVKETSTDMLEEKVLEDIDPDLNEEEGIGIEDSKEEHWRDVPENGEDRKNMFWEIYTREKKEFINIDFLVSVRHPKGGNIVWYCVKDNRTKENEKYEAIGIHRFYYKLFEEKVLRSLGEINGILSF